MRMAHAEMKLFSYINAEQLQQNELQRRESLNSPKLMQETSGFNPEDFSIVVPRRPASLHDYQLAMDFTAAKMVTALIEKCTVFQGITSLYKSEGQELLTTLMGLSEILQIIVGCSCLDPYQDVLKDIMLYTTKAYAFMEKLYFKLLHVSTHGVLRKSALKMGDFACRFFNQTVKLCEIYETSDNSLRTFSPRKERLSFGVTSYVVPLRNVSERLLKKKRVHIRLADMDGTSAYNVELSYPRSWFSKDDAMNAKIESSDRGFSQTVHAGRVKVEKGSWGWEEAQDTVLITYDDLMLANVTAESGSLLSHNKSATTAMSSSPKSMSAQKYRISIQLVGSSRVDSDLQHLFIKGVKDRERVYYKCYVNSRGFEEVLGIYRHQAQSFQHAEGRLLIVGRGNEPGVRHVLVSIFTSLGFTPAV